MVSREAVSAKINKLAAEANPPVDDDQIERQNSTLEQYIHAAKKSFLHTYWK